MADHPFFFTWTPQHGAGGPQVTGGEGAWMHTVDNDGRAQRWLDLGALSYQANLGHGHRAVVEAIKGQADILSLSSPNAIFPAKVELAERLLKLAPPGFTKVFFTLGGAEANENAIKMARAVTGRHKLVARYRSYHGATMGAMTLTGDWRRAANEPGLTGVVHMHDTVCGDCGKGHKPEHCRTFNPHVLGEVLRLEGRGTTAAVILEAIPGANGVIIPDRAYGAAIRKACDDDGALLIADEVLDGFGRCGTTWGFEHWGVTPDIITTAKGIAAGYAPMGAVLVHERVARHFEERMLACGLTYYAHPIGCAAAVATLRAYEDQALFARVRTLAPVFERELAAIAARLKPASGICMTRAVGLLGVLEVDADAAAYATLGRELAARRLQLHVEARRNTSIFAPPYVISEEEMVLGMRAFGDAAVIAFGGA